MSATNAGITGGKRFYSFLLVGVALVLAVTTLFVAYRRILAAERDDELDYYRRMAALRRSSTRRNGGGGQMGSDPQNDADDEGRMGNWENSDQQQQGGGIAAAKLPRSDSVRGGDSEAGGAHIRGSMNGNSAMVDTLMSAEGDILNNPFVDLLKGYYNGTRSFSYVCAIPTQRRIEVKAMSADQRAAAERGDAKALTFYRGEHFLIRDVCALGHFPKELTHLFTHVWRHVMAVARDPLQRAAILAEYETMMGPRRRRGGLNGGGAANSMDESAPEPVDDLEKIYYVMGPRVAPHVIVGNACVSRVAPGCPSELLRTSTGPHRGDKHNGVFHKVMVHWIRAIMFPWLDRQHSSGGGDARSLPEVRTFLSDAAVLSSDEEARFFPFGRGGRHPVGDGTSPSSSSLEEGKFLDAVSVYEDYLSDPETKAPRRLVCFERLYEREERWRWFPNFEVAHRFRLMLWRYYSPLKAMQRKRIYDLLTVPFAMQSKPKVIILRRDEDRHFNEKQTADFIKEKFGAIADIKLVQYDSGGGYKPPSFYEQAVELATADIVIAAHGAALSSAMFMRPGAVLVELFPHNFRYYMYEELAKVLGLEYVAYEGERVSPSGCCSGKNWAGSGGASASIGEGDAEKKGPAAGEGEEDEEQQQIAFAAAQQALQKKDASHLLNFSSRGDAYVQMPRGERLKRIGKIYDLHGNRNCKKCDIEVGKSQWYEIVKNALASVWLANSRLSNLHDFDLRK